jgi:Predicted dehydrogenases and related proteins
MKKVVIFGAGRRVQSHIIPAVVNCSDNLSLSAIYARRERVLSICDEEYEVNILDKSTSSNLKDSDIVVICVSQEECF